MSRRVLWFSTLVLIAACQGNEPTQPGKVLSTPSFGISDGANGGNDDFWFLPPLVPPPNSNPAFLDNGFDGSQPAMVVITFGATTILNIAAKVDGNIYIRNWTIPAGAGKLYKITIKVGATVLGSIDVEGSKTSKTLSIKFVIEHCALVAGACASKTIDLTQGGTLANDDGGVQFPPQGAGQPTVRVFVTGCPDIPTDLPVKSECFRVTTVPAIAGPLNVPANVWACSGLTGPQLGQSQRITMYRFDAPNTTTALPHAHDQCASPRIGDAGFSVRGLVADLRYGRLKSASRQLVGLIGPRTLHASVMLDVGAGGFTDEFSDFQLVLPGILSKCGGDGLTVITGSAVAPKVCVVDLGGVPVEGATVHFAPTTGSVSAPSAVTDINGEASVTWTVAHGPNSLVASGNGIGASDFNGPRAGVDPFQPLFHTEGQGPAVAVLTGSETFTATGVTHLIAYGASGWSYQIDGTVPSGWQTGTSPFAGTGAAPFGSLNSGCGLNTGVVTSWPAVGETFLYARKSFTLATSTQVLIGIAVDNDVQVFVDGNDISATNQQSVVPNGAGLLRHDGCPSLDSFTFVTTTLGAGSHILAIRALDRGGQSYFDARVTIFSP